MDLSENEIKDLVYAKTLLEHPSFAAKMMNAAGLPIETGIRCLPEKISRQVYKVSEKAIRIALNCALFTMKESYLPALSSDLFHKIIATASGFAGGFFGLAALSIELPIATTIILRSVADIARSEGENIKTHEAKLSCIEVFALGGRREDGTETGYFAVRFALSNAVSEALNYITEQGIVEQGAPMLVRLIAQIASRFGVIVSEKLAAAAVPIIGAAGGAVINMIFINHFQDVARGHFIIRRLERKFGSELVQAEYEKIMI